MALPKYNPKDKISQKIFYSELKKQIDEIDSLKDKAEKKRRMSKLRLDLYIAITNQNITSLKEDKKEKTFLINILNSLKQVIIRLLNILKGILNE